MNNLTGGDNRLVISSESVVADYEKSLCGQLECHACCQDMQMTVSVADFRDFIEFAKTHTPDIKIKPIPAKNIGSFMAAVQSRDDRAVYYFAPYSYRNPRSPKPTYLETMKDSDTIRIVINGKCPNVLLGKCQAFGTTGRFPQCVSFEAGTTPCVSERKEKYDEKRLAKWRELVKNQQLILQANYEL